MKAPTILLALLALTGSLCRADDNSIIPPFTHSPNGQYGVSVPIFKNVPENAIEAQQNKVVDLKSNQVVAAINARPGLDQTLNYREVAPPRWSADSSTLLWKVEGKWCPTALVVLHIADGKQDWQLDLLKTGQAEILARTQTAAPGKYAAAVKANAGSGSNFPDGFTVDVVPSEAGGNRVSLPLSVHVTLTSNPKLIEGFPANLNSTLDGSVTTDGKFVVKTFKVGK